MEEFTKEYVAMWKRWSDFAGRSTVRELWMAILINFLIGLIFTGLGYVAGFFNTISYIYSLAILVPMLALWFRRMHDINKSPLNLLWWFLPVIGWIIIIYLSIQPSKASS